MRIKNDLKQKKAWVNVAFVVCAFVLLVLGTGTGRAAGTAITIADYNFIGSFSSWATFGNGSEGQYIPTVGGSVGNPNPNNYASGNAPPGGAATNGCGYSKYAYGVNSPIGFSQTLTNTLASNTVYTLTGYLGNGYNQSIPYSDGAYAYIQLLAGTNVIASTNVSPLYNWVAQGTFGQWSISYTAPASGVPSGTLQIVLGFANGNDNNGDTVNWADIGLTSSPAPVLTASQNPSLLGGSVTFTATVTGPGVTPTGTVTFMDGSTTLGTGTLNGSGVATFTTTQLSIASHTITAVYGGDSNYTGGTSTPLTQVVNSRISVVRTATASSGGGADSATATFSSATTAGNLLVVAIWYDTTVQPTPTITDNSSGGANTYTDVGEWHYSANGGYNGSQIFYAKNIKGGNTTVSVTGPSGSHPSFCVYEISGASTTAPLYAHTSADNESGAVSVGVTPSAGDFVVAAGTASSPATGFNSSFVNDYHVAGQNLGGGEGGACAHYVTSSGSSVSTFITSGGNINGSEAVIASFTTAGNVPINNRSFEADALANGANTTSGAYSWSSSGTYAGALHYTALSGNGMFPQGSSYPNAHTNLFDGPNIAYISGGLYLSNVLSATLGAVGTTYTLSGVVAHRNDYSNPAKPYVQLFAGSNVIIGPSSPSTSNYNITDPALDSITNWSLTYTVQSGDPVGQTLKIVLGNVSGDQISFDNLSLTYPSLGPVSAYKITAAGTTPGAGTNDIITITQVDSSGATETGYNGTTNLTFSGLSAGPDSSLATVNGTSLGTATSISFTNGVATATLVAHKAETATLAATDGTYSTATTGGSGVSLTVSAGTATKLAYTTVPSTGTAGTAFSVTVQSQDTYGNPANLASSTTITLSKATGGGTLSGTLTGSIGSSANSVTIATPVYSKSDTMTLTATASGGVTLTAVTSGNIVFSPGTATHLVYTTVPSTGTAGTAFSVTVQSQDANGNPANPTSSTTITLSKATGGGSLSGTLAGTIGTSTNSVTIATPVYSKSDTMTLTATATAGMTGLTAITSGNIVFSPGTAMQLVYTTVPSTGTAGTAFSVTVQSQDANGNPSSPTSTTTITLSKATGGGSLSGTLTGTIGTSGNSVTIATPVYSKSDTMTLTATATAGMTGLTAITSGNIVFSPGTATQLVYTTVPSTGTAGTAFSVTVQSQDANGNPSSPTSTTTITLSKATGGGSLSGTLTGTIGTSGNSVTIATPVYSKSDTMTLTATATAGMTSLTAITSGSIVFSPGTATHLVYTTVPGTGTAGTAFSVTVQSQDANGNPSSPTSTTTITLSKATGGGSLSGTLTGTIGTSGNSVTIATPVYSKSDTMTLTATATAGMTGLTATTSGNIVFSPGAVTAAQSTVTASPTSVTANGTNTSTITVTLTDANSNPVSGKTVTLALNSGFGSPTISAASGASDGSGVVTFTVKSTTAGADVFKAMDVTDASLQITQTATVTFTAGPASAAQSTVAASPTSVTADGSTTSTITLTLKDANNNLASGRTVTLAKTSGSGTPTITTTQGLTDASGVATFTVVSTTAAADVFTATDTTDSVTVTQTATVTFTVGAVSAAHSTISPATASITADGASTQVITVQARDVNNNNLTSGGATVVISKSSGTGTITGTTDNGNGTYTATVTAPTATGSGTFVATLGGTAVGTAVSASSSVVTYTAGAVSATHSTVSPATASITADVASTQVVTVQARDANNNNRTTGGDTVVISKSSGTGTITGTTDNGNGTYTATVTAPTATGSGTFVATLGGTAVGTAVSASSSVVTYAPGGVSASHSTVSPATASITADGSSTQVITVQARDANNNNLTSGGASGAITKSAGTGSVGSTTDNGNGTYTATVTAPSASGSGTFTATLGGVAVGTAVGATSAVITYTPSPSAYRITAITNAPTAGVGDQLIITLVGADGSTVTSFSGDQTLTFYNGLGNAPGGNIPTVTDKNGSAVNQGSQEVISFTNGVSSAGGLLVAYKAETATLNVVDTSYRNSWFSPGGSGVSLTVEAAPANHLAFSTSPAGAAYKTAFTTQPVVITQDAYGNNSTNGLGSTVTVNLALSTGTGPLAGTTSTNIGTAGGNGTATFSGVQANKAENGDVLTASATGFTNGISSAFNVSTVALTVSAAGVSKSYDGTTNTTVTLSDNRVSGDSLTDNYTGASFANKNAGTNKTVAVSGISINGPDAGNYSLSATTASTAANISPSNITVTAAANTKVYDGTTNAAATPTVTTGSVQTGDTANFTEAYTNKNAGSGKVLQPAGTVTDGNSGNNYSYTFVNSANGTITPAGTSVLATSSANPSGYKDSVVFTATNLPADATGSVVFKTNSGLFATEPLSSGATTATNSTLPRGTNTITAEYAGDGNYVGSTNNLAGGQIVTNHPPVAAVINATRTAGTRLRIFFANVATNWSDADGDTVTMTGLNLVTALGVNLATNSTQILYTNGPATNDLITYTISDGQGGTNTGIINVVVNPFVTGQQTSSALTFSNNAVTATFYGIPGYTYEVQRSPDLSPNSWVDISTNTLSAQTGNSFTNLSAVIISVTDSNPPPGNAAYYRLKWQP